MGVALRVVVIYLLANAVDAADVSADMSKQCPVKLQKGCMPLSWAIKMLDMTDPAACCAACIALESCAAFTLNQKLSTCFLHPKPATLTDGECVSGLVHRAPSPPAPKRAKNVLMLIVDDLRPEIRGLGFNQTEMITPNIDRLLSNGVGFTRAYCQQAICGPTRNSFLTGRRPQRTKV